MKEEKYTCDICHEERDLSELTYFDESYLCEDCLRREHLFAVIAVTDTGMMIRQMVTCAKLVTMKITSDVKDVTR